MFKRLLLAICLLSTATLKAQNDCPTWEWAYDIQLPSSSDLLVAHGDTAGNIYVMGSFQGTMTLGSTTLSTPDTSHFVAMYSKNQTWDWAVKYDAKLPAGFHNYSIPEDFHYSPSGYITVAGIYTHSASFGMHSLPETYRNISNTFVARLNTSTLQWEWATAVQGPMRILPGDINGDTAGNVYVAGHIDKYGIGTDTAFFDTISKPLTEHVSFLGKINTNGNWQWVSTPKARVYGPKVAVDNQGNPVLVTNMRGTLNFGGQSISSPGGKYSMIVLGYSANGTELWYKKVQGSNKVGGPRIAYAGYDPVGALYVLGESYIDTLQFGNTTLTGSPNVSFVAKLTASNQWGWAEYFGGQNNLSLNLSVFYGTALKEHKGSLYFTGRFTGVIRFGNDVLDAKNSSALFVCKMDSSGLYQWGGAAYAPFGSTQISAVGLTVDNDENVYVAGFNDQSHHFGMYTVKPYGKFVAKLGRDSLIMLTLPKDTTIYCGDSIQLTARTNSVAQLTYQWSPAAGLSSTTEPFPMASPDSATVYTLNVSSANGCSAIAKVKVSRDSLRWFGSGMPISTSTGGRILCDTVPMYVSGPPRHKSYKWNTGSIYPTILVKKPGVYILTTSDERGCYRKDSIEIIGPSKITPGEPLICVNDSVELSINIKGLDSIRWEDGTDASSRYVYQAGKYWASLHKDGCVFTDTVEVRLFTQTGNATFTARSNNLEVTFTASSAGIDQATWRFGDGGVASGKRVTHTYSGHGNYNVCLEAVDICGVSARHCMQISVPGVALEEFQRAAKFSLYPNPVEGLLHIRAAEEGTPFLEILDIRGKILFKKMLSHNDRWQVKVDHLSPGYYFIRVDGQTSRFVKK